MPEKGALAGAELKSRLDGHRALRLICAAAVSLLAMASSLALAQRPAPAGSPTPAERTATAQRLERLSLTLQEEARPDGPDGLQLRAALDRWRVTGDDAVVRAIFDPAVPAQTGLEATIKRYVREAGDPWPAASTQPDRQLAYVGCVLGRKITRAHRRQVLALSALATQLRTSAATPPDLAQAVRDAERVPAFPATASKCLSTAGPLEQVGAEAVWVAPIREPDTPVTIQGVGAEPVNVDWSATCLQSERAESDGTAAPHHPTTAALMYDDGRNGLVTYCSGTLIAPNVVLTAAHCVCETSAKDPGGNFYRTAEACVAGGFRRRGRLLSTLETAHHSVFFQHAGHIPIASVIVHPEFRWTNPLPRSDLAILLLSEDVLGIAPMAINTQTRLPPDVSAASVGYGAHTPIDEQGNMTDTSTVVELAGLKLQANIVTAPCGPAERARNLICWSYRGKGKRTSTGSSCRGDSGGPLYATSTSGPLLVGVTSAGGPSCLAGTVAYDMEVFAYRDWIRKHVEIAPSALRRVSTATLWRADRGDRDRIRQLVCTTCTRCADPAQSKGQVTIPAGARSMRVSVNCTPDEAGGSSGELGLIVRPRIGVVLPARQMQSPGCATSGRSTALSCSLPVTPGESWVVELRAGQRQQCQIVATVSR